MKKAFILITNFVLCLSFLLPNAFSRHCPTDGGTIVVVKLVDRTEKTVFNQAKYLKLVEVNNPEVDNCYGAAKLTVKSFLPTKAAMEDRY